MSGFVITFAVSLAAGWMIGRAERRARRADPIETLWGTIK